MTSLESTIRASREALKHANINIKDIDFAEVHDCFTIAEIIAMEDLGIFEKGEAGKAVVEGRTSSAGKSVWRSQIKGSSCWCNWSGSGS